MRKKLFNKRLDKELSGFLKYKTNTTIKIRQNLFTKKWFIKCSINQSKNFDTEADAQDYAIALLRAKR